MRAGYSYIVLQYVHDIVRGECVNVGVVVFAPDSQFLRGRFISDFSRPRAMFGEIDEAHLCVMLQHLEHALAEFQFHQPVATRDISHLVKSILPADDSSLQWSSIGGSITNDLAGTLGQLFQRFIAENCESVAVL